ncbi:MAG: alpha/beta hydrolase, partial [Candidatus Altiarchaeota archaeon]|nr:alpha/beta hydrolase [Candidatus Altiarchaeota archaeon]
SVGGGGEWSNMHLPVGIRATYYYVSYYDANILSKTISKEAGVESYSIRLKEIVDLVLEQTNSDKVVIVAHSMGGLVTRNYLMLFGESKVDRVLLIATPNDGFSGRVVKLCSYFGDENSCSDMTKDSVFLRKLSFFTPTIPFGVIAGLGCDTDGMDGDGIVQAESAKLDYAKMFYVSGECPDFLGSNLHNELLDPQKYPGVYVTVKKFILNSTFLS